MSLTGERSLGPLLSSTMSSSISSSMSLGRRLREDPRESACWLRTLLEIQACFQDTPMDNSLLGTVCKSPNGLSSLTKQAYL